jgi:hypothetical protein
LARFCQPSSSAEPVLANIQNTINNINDIVAAIEPDMVRSNIESRHRGNKDNPAAGAEVIA